MPDGKDIVRLKSDRYDSRWGTESITCGYKYEYTDRLIYLYLRYLVSLRLS